MKRAVLAPSIGVVLTSLVTLLALLTFPAASSPGDWTEQVSNSSATLVSVHAVTRDIAWAIGDSGKAVRTLDGGLDWELRPVPAAGHLRGLFALDGNVAIVGNQLGQLFRTADGGGSWTQVYAGTGRSINAIHFFDPQRGWAMGDPVDGRFVLLESTDGGLGWARSASEPPAPDGSSGFLNVSDWVGSEIGAFGTNNWVVWRTTNGGFEWHPVMTGVNAIFGLALGDGGVGFIGGATDFEAVLERTTDFGASWHRVPTPGPSYSSAPFDWVQGTDHVWASTPGNRNYQSTNAGKTWMEHVLAADYIAEDLDFADATTGWSVGSRFHKVGRIWKYTDGSAGVGEVPEREPSLRVTVTPNPSAAFVFRFDGAGSGPIRVLLYDLAGRHVATVVGPRGEETAREVRWEGQDASGRSAPGGVYYFRAEAVGELAWGSVVKLR